MKCFIQKILFILNVSFFGLGTVADVGFFGLRAEASEKVSDTNGSFIVRYLNQKNLHLKVQRSFLTESYLVDNLKAIKGYLEEDAQSVLIYWKSVITKKDSFTNEGFMARYNTSYLNFSFHFATLLGPEYYDVVKFLIEAGADVNSRLSNNIPFRVADSRASSSTIIALFLRGRDVKGKWAFHNLTPLHVASMRESSDVIKLLLEAGADVNAKAAYNLTPLHMVSSQKSSSDVIKLLIESGADVNAKAVHNLTPLHYASAHGFFGVMKFLIEAGADANARTTDGFTSLHIASSQGDSNILRSFEGGGATINAETVHGSTPFYKIFPASMRWMYYDVIKLLIESGVDVNARTVHGSTPLHIASSREWESDRKEYFDVITLLIEAGADVNLLDENGSNPLHYASQYGKLKIVKLLVKAGVDTNVENGFFCMSFLSVFCGGTPLDQAKEQGHALVVNFLEKLEKI